MYREKKILRNYILYLLIGLLICFIGLSDIFADTIIDTSTWIQTTGRKWSLGTQEYTNNPSYNNDWLLNAYNITGGIYTPPDTYDYIEFLYFEHNTNVFNPCNSTSKFTADFKLLFSNPSFVSHLSSVKWGNDNCNIKEKNTTTGVVSVSCIASPSTDNYTDIFAYFDTISGTNSSYLYISRNIDVSCGLNTDAIINNDNANTQNIINNNNQNTQDIINNNNQNTQDMIDSQKVCKNILNIDLSFNKGYYISYSTGNLVSDSNYYYTDFIELFDSHLVISNTSGYSFGSVLAFYDKDKNYIDFYTIYNRSVDLSNYPTAKYIRISNFYTDFSLKYPSPVYSCINGNQAVTDSVNDLNDSLNDDDTDGATSEASDFFESFTTNTFGLTSIITAPLNLIQSLTSSSCTDLHLPLPYLNNKYLDLPCMSSIYQQYFGSFFTIYQTITYGIIAYWVCVRIFNQVKDFKNPEHDEIEVVDL